ncbi:YcaO-like family protein, partial [Streptomyces anulatus]|uniref:YcaO-like family protein n=1 Tax=Streptomyces anulatus TaxID=1892 RepID=UPI00342ED5B4
MADVPARLTLRTTPFDTTTRVLSRRMVNPLCGLTPRLKFGVRGRSEPRIAIAGAELTGVHVFHNGRPIPPESHHLGGAGVLLDEPLIKSLGESAERYCHYSFPAQHRDRIRFASHREMTEQANTVPARESLVFFTDAQFERPGFLFDRFDPDAPMGWLPMSSLTGETTYWAPAQLTMVGYRPRRKDGEPWLNAAVTTGTATHSDPGKALLSAIEELIQLDSVMGHWHSDRPSVLIRHDARLRALDGLIERYWRKGAPPPEFHLLPNPDLPGFTIACLYRNGHTASVPVAAGLGSDLRLPYAMYKALLESVAVFRYASWMAAKRTADGAVHTPGKDNFFDLADNVAYYTEPANAAIVERRFAVHTQASAGDLPPDVAGDTRACAAHLVDAFAATG